MCVALGPALQLWSKDHNNDIAAAEDRQGQGQKETTLQVLCRVKCISQTTVIWLVAAGVKEPLPEQYFSPVVLF
jgi:hypothetical protein